MQALSTERVPIGNCSLLRQRLRMAQGWSQACLTEPRPPFTPSHNSVKLAVLQMTQEYGHGTSKRSYAVVIAVVCARLAIWAACK